MKAGQRVVKSIPDRSGNNYTKTSAGGKSRMQAATRYMDERENTQLYSLENGRIVEIDRERAAAQIEDTQTKYQQHLAFTTQLEASKTLINEREITERVARSIQERRPDAEIYAIAVHSDGKGQEKQVHVHVAMGTKTTLHKDDLIHFREEAYKLERHLERENVLEIEAPERQQERQHEQSQEQTHQQPERSPERPRQMEMEL